MESLEFAASAFQLLPHNGRLDCISTLGPSEQASIYIPSSAHIYIRLTRIQENFSPKIP